MTKIVKFPEPRLQISLDRDFGLWWVAIHYASGKLKRRIATAGEAEAKEELERLLSEGSYELRQVPS